MVELKRTVKKTVEEKYMAELKPSWCVRLLRPNGNRTYYVSYEQKFMYEPSEQEIASIIAEHSNCCNEFASVVKNYQLVEIKEQKQMDKCEYEKNGHCTLNECMYGDFLFIDDSAFDTGKYCLCDNVEQLKEQKNE